MTTWQYGFYYFKHSQYRRLLTYAWDNLHGVTLIRENSVYIEELDIRFLKIASSLTESPIWWIWSVYMGISG